MEIATEAACQDGKAVVEAKATTELGITPTSAVPTLPKIRRENREQQWQRAPDTTNSQLRQKLLRQYTARACIDPQTAQVVVDAAVGGGQLLLGYLMYKLAKRAQDKHPCDCSGKKSAGEKEDEAGIDGKKKKEKAKAEQSRQKKHDDYDPSVA